MTTPIRLLSLLLLSATLLLGSGCKQNKANSRAPEAAENSTSTSGVTTRTGSQLAYEIDLQITLPTELIATRLEALRQAWEGKRTSKAVYYLALSKSKIGAVLNCDYFGARAE
jgi:hypothetical protein